MLSTVGLAACAVGTNVDTSTSSSSSGGVEQGPCPVDCSKFEVPQCTVAVCNTGQVVGPLNTCVVIPAPQGTACDDGKFCTIGDSCDNGTCVGGEPNHCGTAEPECTDVICYEDTKSCAVTPVDEGTPCTATDLCEINGVCTVGKCVGEPKDCSFSPLIECNKVACDPSTGECKGTPDASKDEAPCVLTGDFCTINRTCSAGQCNGGTAKDCSALNVDCQVGVCDDTTGICGQTPAPAGAACSDGIPQCYLGACDGEGTCDPSPMPDGVACNDHNSCSQLDTCTSGGCSGSPVSGCVTYLQQGFETCPGGWTLGGDWQCGTPVNVGPIAAHSGKNCIATQIGGNYSVNQSFNTAVADSPPIDLTMATTPQLSFWVWDYTEGSTFDGWNVKVSTNGGTTFTEVMTVTPPYDCDVVNQPSWGGNHSAEGWVNYFVDLTAYAGKTIVLRFGFHSDGATVFPGVYIDDVVVAEPLQIPLYVSTPAPLPDVYAGQLYNVPLTKTGGASDSTWSIVSKVHADWLSITSTGILTGTPQAADEGPVTVTVHVEEPALPSNFAEATYTFNVKSDLYYTSFEGTCPDGWTLTGDWQCGVPMNVGPATAYVGTQCLGTQIAGLYSNNQTWAGTTATSPDIDLSSTLATTLTFRMWIDTEGGTYDGANLQISTDGGVTYTVLETVMPSYTLMISGEDAWGGHDSTLGWQPVQVDLSPYVGETIRLRFAFRSDTSGTYAGVYIDDILVN